MENNKKVRASRRKYHYIYRTTCLINNKYYIGMHSTDNLEDGYQGSGTILARSIRYHGRENHQTEILEFLPSREELRKREAQLITEELLDDRMCMNLVLGGSGGCTTESQFKRASAGGKAAVKILEELRKDPEWVKNNSTNISKGIRLAMQNGKFTPPSFEGKTHSKQTKKKMSEKAKLRTGNKNSQFGTCWVYNSETKQCIKIKNTEIDSYLTNGWTKGRKMKF